METQEKMRLHKSVIFTSESLREIIVLRLCLLCPCRCLRLCRLLYLLLLRRLLVLLLSRLLVLLLLDWAENLDIVGVNLGNVSAHSSLVIIDAGFQFSLDIEFRALVNVLLGDFGEIAPNDDRMPLSAVWDLCTV